MSSELIRYKDICVDFHGSRLFSKFNLIVNQGDKLILKGRSGSGKSTLLKIILGIIHVDDGEIFYRGRKVSASNIWDIRKEIAYVSQDTDIGEGIVKDLINEIFSFDHNRGRKYHRKRNSLIEYFGLDRSIVYKKFEDLSGGEKQRICIIISVLLGKEIFLLDEVTSALDPELKEKVVDFFLENEDWTLLVASHDNTWDRVAMDEIFVDGCEINA
jgi:putative ABC transport system ATP-binding protein